jgi:Tumour protein p53-inducible protein 11
MNTRGLMTLSAAIEAATGLSLIAFPSVVARLLLGAELAGSGIAIARLTGIALLCLGLACWPSGANASKATVRALFTYNLLASLYLCYLRFAGGFAGYLLLPAFALHALLAVLLLRSMIPSYHSERDV